MDSTHAAASGGVDQATHECVMRSGGKDVLVVMPTASDAKCTAKDGELHLKKGNMEVHLWLVQGAKTVDQGVAQAAKVITPEFTSFTTTQTTIVALGSPGSSTQLMGTGYEADDGDPGTAKVIVFVMGEHAFIACVHGEYLSPDAQKWMEEVVKSARGPVVKMGK
jgi:hypothetical protein